MVTRKENNKQADTSVKTISQNSSVATEDKREI